MSLLLKLVGAATNPAFVHDYRSAGGLVVTSWVPVTPLEVQGVTSSYVHIGSLGVNSWTYIVPTAAPEVAIPFAVGDAAAAGVPAAFRAIIAAGVGNASGNGTTATLSRPLASATGGASAFGVQAGLRLSVLASIGEASALGVTATAASTASYGITYSYMALGSLQASTWTGDGLAGVAATGTLNCIVGDAAATGLSAVVRAPIVATVGNASASGVTLAASGSYGIASHYVAMGSFQATSWLGDGVSVAPAGNTLPGIVGEASANGSAATLRSSVIAAVGNAAAEGAVAALSSPGQNSVTCTVGNAAAVGVSATAGQSLALQIGNAAATGLTAQLKRIFGPVVGNAIADGVACQIVQFEPVTESATDYYRRVANDIMSGRADGPSNNMFVRIGRR